MTKRLPRVSLDLLKKAQESALQAVSTYNDPRSGFRTGNFTVLMVIAWTSLLHSYFELKKARYYYKKPNGRYKYVDGDRKAWELGRCIKEVFEDSDPVRKNIELFIKLRNKIEHRNLPALDQETQGECQALVLNFESWLVKEFGKERSIIDTMFIPIQLTTSRRNIPKSKAEGVIIKFVKDYRSLLSADVEQSQQYQFKAFLLPKIGNHRSSSDVAIEYIKYDETNPEEMEKYNKAVIAIKEKQVPVVNPNLYKPSIILNKIKDYINYRPTMNWHTSMWHKYGVRPLANAKNRSVTKSEYCFYDASHDDYLYTDKWAEMLIEEELKNKATKS